MRDYLTSSRPVKFKLCDCCIYWNGYEHNAVLEEGHTVKEESSAEKESNLLWKTSQWNRNKNTIMQEICKFLLSGSKCWTVQVTQNIYTLKYRLYKAEYDFYGMVNIL